MTQVRKGGHKPNAFRIPHKFAISLHSEHSRRSDLLSEWWCLVHQPTGGHGWLKCPACWLVSNANRSRIFPLPTTSINVLIDSGHALARRLLTPLVTLRLFHDPDPQRQLLPSPRCDSSGGMDFAPSSYCEARIDCLCNYCNRCCNGCTSRPKPPSMGMRQDRPARVLIVDGS